MERMEREDARHESASRMDLVTHLAAVGVGATAMYFLDPARGRHRRDLVRDQLMHAAKQGAEALGPARAQRERVAPAEPMPGRDADDRIAKVARAESGLESRQENWTPTARLLAGVAGGALTAMALRAEERTASRRTLLGIAGAALIVRSATNKPLGHLVGATQDDREITIRKSITIAASIDDVFNWLIAWESWPRWMSHVRRVRTIRGSGAARECTHWEVVGPAGTTIEWDAETTEIAPPHVIRWRTIDASPIAHAGALRLFPASDHATRLDLQVTYVAAGGAPARGLARLLRRSPERRIDDELARLKRMIEAVRSPPTSPPLMAQPDVRASDARRETGASDSMAARPSMH